MPKTHDLQITTAPEVDGETTTLSVVSLICEGEGWYGTMLDCLINVSQTGHLRAADYISLQRWSVVVDSDGLFHYRKWDETFG